MLPVFHPLLRRCLSVVLLFGLGMVARAQLVPPATSTPPVATGATGAVAGAATSDTLVVLNVTGARSPQFGPAGFSITAEPQQLRIGTQVTLTLRARDAGFDFGSIVDVHMQPDDEHWQRDRAWSRTMQQGADGGMSPWRAKLRPFATGRVALPEFTVEFRQRDGSTTRTQIAGLALQVDSVLLPNAENLDLVPLRDPVDIPRDWTPLWVVLGAVAGVALLALLVRHWLLRRRRRPADVQAAPQLPPGLWALGELDRRSRLPVCTTGPPKLVYSHVSEVIRIYLGRRFNVDAIDMTSLECLRTLRQLPEDRRPAEDALRWIETFFNDCDLVKFTTHEPPREQWPTAWSNARLIVTITTPHGELDGAGAPSTGTAARAAEVDA